ncbi:hypothetical protein DAEQUDRAFT_161610 [Daedalea quercina L-15889]|uniref:Secreted protein n=1 Tax=Daedalea quercina L-15889 TaxID=1314783 RepID=A0A165KKF8_9APHY|nr:hypothetical protein DAEQUDRAFT_161610 [Daedalea quercina L-15889]
MHRSVVLSSRVALILSETCIHLVTTGRSELLTGNTASLITLRTEIDVASDMKKENSCSPSRRQRVMSGLEVPYRRTKAYVRDHFSATTSRSAKTTPAQAA